MRIETVLEKYGLKPNYIKTLLTCLELGSGSVLSISKRAGIARSSCQLILQSLQERGFVSSYKKKRATQYAVHDPRRIVELQKEKTALLENTLPQLLARYGTAPTQPSVRLYQGVEGMSIVLNEILAEAKELCSFANDEFVFSILAEEFPWYIKKRVERKIPIRVILRDSPKARSQQQAGRQELREVRIVDTRFQWSGMIMVWKNKTAHYSFDDDIFVLVTESKDIAGAQRAMFDIIWNNLLEIKPRDTV